MQRFTAYFWQTDICGRLFLIITLMNLGHTCLLYKGFCTVYFGDKEKNGVTLMNTAQRKHASSIKTKEKAKSKKVAPKKKIPLELLQHGLGHRSTRSLMVSDSAKFWHDIKLRIDPDPFYISCQVYLMNKKASSKTPLKLRAPFK